MQQEFMLYILNAGDAKAALSPEAHLAFIKKCEKYIGELKSGGHLVAAQPLLREGCTIAKKGSGWNMELLDAMDKVQVGYYHIRANDLDEALKLAKDNPEFEYVPSASIEVRPIKMKEEETGFVYPK